MSILEWELQNAKSRYKTFLMNQEWVHDLINVGDFQIELTANKRSKCLPLQDLPLVKYTHFEVRFFDESSVCINPWEDERFKHDHNFRKIYKTSSDHADYVSIEDLKELHQLLWVYSKK